MIDFKEYTNIGLRNITFNGVNSLSDLGIVITTEGTNVGELEVKSSQDSLAHMQGSLDSSRIDGTLYYEARKLVYRFKLVANDIEVLKALEQSVYEWLNSSGTFTIQDSDYSGYEFRRCELKGISSESGETLTHGEYSYVTAAFECYPFMFKLGEANERVLKFTANGGATLTVTNNSAYSVTANGTTTTGSFTVNEPYKYRLVVYAENPETITLNGSAIAAEEVFTMPSSAEIIVSATGYKYVELWHDTRTGVRL